MTTSASLQNDLERRSSKYFINAVRFEALRLRLPRGFQYNKVMFAKQSD